MQIVGQIRFDGNSIDVYGSLDEPCFLAEDVVRLLGLKNKGALLDMIEEDESIKYTLKNTFVITELGFLQCIKSS